MQKKNLKKRFCSKIHRLFSLKFVLIVPFVIQLLVVVGLMGYFSFGSGQKSINEVTAELRHEIIARIEQHFKNHLKTAHIVNKINADALRLGLLDINDPIKVQRHFWQQLQTFKSLGYISFSGEQGQFIAAERREDHSIVIGEKSSDKFYLYTEKTEHLSGNQGCRKKLTLQFDNYDPRTRPWYKATKKANKPIWSEIDSLIDPENLTTPVTQKVPANKPYYDDKGTFQGVLGTDIYLSQINEFLSTLKIGQTGKTFIMERDGFIVASSTSEKPYRINPDNSKEVSRLCAYDSQNHLIRHTAQHLKAHFGHLNNITNNEQLEFKLKKQRQFLQVKPFQDEQGIDWLIVVVIPQSDFMEHIDANMRLTFALFLLTLLVAIMIGIFTAKWVIKPITHLMKAAVNISYGKWEQKLPTGRFDEIGILAQVFQRMAQQLKELFENLEHKVAERTVQLRKKNELIRRLFGRYLTDEIVDTLLDTKSGLSLGGERREITILTSDLRGFTAQSNKLPPEQVIKMLNFYLKVMTDVITEYQGTIDKFMGDGILVLFGAPIARDDDPERAVACSIAMQLAMDEINQQLQTWGFDALEMGIGINTGEVVVGNIGSEKRTQYSVLGNEVNLVYRIESYTVGGQIFISESTLQKVAGIIAIQHQKTVKPKGIKQPITIYDITGIGGKYNLHLPQEKEFFIPLQENIQVQCTILEGKHLREQSLVGDLYKLSAKGALISCWMDKSLVPESSNLKMNFLLPNQEVPSEDIYAKILDSVLDENSFLEDSYSIEELEPRIYVRFTTPLPAKLIPQLVAFYQLEWTADLSVNHSIMDEQHKQLFIKSRKLITSICEKKFEFVIEIIGFLEEYVVTHFELEENYMKQCDYPDIAMHKSQHAKFIKNVNQFKKAYQKNPTGYLNLAIKIQQTLIEWLVHHIGESDKQLSTFLKSCSNYEYNELTEYESCASSLSD